VRAISHRTSGANRVEMTQGGRKRRLVSQLNASVQIEGTNPFFACLPQDLGHLDDGDVLGSTTRWGNRGRCGILGASGHEPTITREPVTGRLGVFAATAATDTFLDSEQDALGSNVEQWHWAMALDAGGYTGPDSRSMFFYSTGTNLWSAGQGGWIFNMSGGASDIPTYGVDRWGSDTGSTEIEFESNTTEPLYLATWAGIVRRTDNSGGRYATTLMDETPLSFASGGGYFEPLPSGALYKFSLGAYSGSDISLGGLILAVAFWDVDTDETELRRRQRLLRAASNLWSA
jgi:hypothetical protein